MRQGDHVSQMRRGEGAISELIPLDERGHYRSGILIFSRREKMLHANRRALKLTGHLDQAEIEPVCEIHSAPVRRTPERDPSSPGPSQSCQYLGALRIEACPLWGKAQDPGARI